MILYSSTSVFLCQYLSTTAPYTLILLLHTNNNGFHSLIQFSTLNIFHHHPIHIHSLTVHTVQFFSPNTPVSAFCIIVILLHTHSFIYQPMSIIFFSYYFSFPCQDTSTTAPYTFTHLPPTLYNIFHSLPQFSPLSTFHHSPIHIHSLTYKPYNFFSPNTAVFSFCIIVKQLHTHLLIYQPICIIIFFQYLSFPLSESFHPAP